MFVRAYAMHLTSIKPQPTSPGQKLPLASGLPSAITTVASIQFVTITLVAPIATLRERERLKGAVKGSNLFERCKFPHTFLSIALELLE